MRRILTILLISISVSIYGQRASTQQVVSGGGGGGTVTEVSSTNVNTLTVANPSSTPTLTIKTDTVSSTGTGLSTQKQIFDFVTSRNYLLRSELKDSVAKIKIPFVSDSVYDASLWDGNMNAATKNAIRDKIESISAGSSKWDSDTYGISYPSANVGVGNVSLNGFRFYSKASSGYSGLFEQTNVNASGLQIKMASSSNLYPSLHITDGSTARLSWYNNGFLEMFENTTGVLPGSSGFGRLYGSGGKIYYKNSSNVTYDLTSGGGMNNPMVTTGDIIYGGASGTPTRLSAGLDGQILLLENGIPQWRTPSGTSKWTNDTYGINYQSGNVGIGGVSSNTSALTVSKSVASGWGAVIQNTNSSTGSGLLVRSDVNNESYPVLRLNFGASNTMFTFLNNGHMAQRAVFSVPGTAPTSYGYWYVYDGKPFFKYGSTAYDLTTGSSYILPTASSSTKGGVMIDASDGGLKMISDILALDINKLQTATPASNDIIAISDASDSYATRKTTISSLAALIGGGMSNPMTTAGDLIYGGTGGAPTRLGIGSDNQVLTMLNGLPSWQNIPSGFADPMTTRGDIIIRNSSNVTARLGRGTAGQMLTSNGTDISWQTYAGSSSLVTLGTVTQGTWAASTIPADRGGTGHTAYTVGDILYASALGTLSRLSPGTAGHILQTNGTGNAPSWVPAPTPGGGMTYPSGSGIPIVVSGSSWGTTITNNSANWNTAYSWGNHSGLYAPVAHVGATGSAHGNATTSVAGFMAASDKTKLDGIAANANNYVHPSLNHIPTGGSSNQLLRYASSGTAEWWTPNYLTGNQSITLSGDITGTGTTSITTTIGSGAVKSGMLNNNVISGQTELASGLVSTDELLVSDNGTIKRMDVSVLQDYMQDSLNFEILSSPINMTGSTNIPSNPTSNNGVLYQHSTYNLIYKNMAGANKYVYSYLESDSTPSGLTANSTIDTRITCNRQFGDVSGSYNITLNNIWRGAKGSIVIIHSNSTAYTVTLYGNTDGSGNDITAKTVSGSGQLPLSTGGSGFVSVIEWQYVLSTLIAEVKYFQ